MKLSQTSKGSKFALPPHITVGKPKIDRERRRWWLPLHVGQAVWVMDLDRLCGLLTGAGGPPKSAGAVIVGKTALEKWRIVGGLFQAIDQVRWAEASDYIAGAARAEDVCPQTWPTDLDAEIRINTVGPWIILAWTDAGEDRAAWRFGAASVRLTRDEALELYDELNHARVNLPSRGDVAELPASMPLFKRRAVRVWDPDESEEWRRMAPEGVVDDD